MSDYPQVSAEPQAWQVFCRINHSCCPTAVWSYLEGAAKVKEVRAIRDIKEAQEITTNYVDSYEMVTAGRSERQGLLQHWDFVCQCEVCTRGEEEVARNDGIRRAIGVQHQLVAKYFGAWKVGHAVTAARAKLDLMMSIRNEVLASLPSALLGLWEVARVARELGQVEEDCEALLQEAAVLARTMGETFLRQHRAKVAQVEEAVKDVAIHKKRETKHVWNEDLEEKASTRVKCYKKVMK